MTLFQAIVSFAGAVALLLWGAHMLQSGLQRIFRVQTLGLLERALANRLSAFVVGAVVATMLQSSTATAFITASLARRGRVGLVSCSAIMLGAGAGTTLVVQALSFQIEWLPPILIVIGMCLFRRRASASSQQLGRMLIGIGLVLASLHLLADSLLSVRSFPNFVAIVSFFTKTHLIAAISGALLAWATHSSAATIVMVVSLTTSGVVDSQTGLALVLGANFGSAINPILQLPKHSPPEVRRIPYGNAVLRAAMTLPALTAMDSMEPIYAAFGSPDPGRLLANINTVINLVFAVLALPLLGPFARFLELVIRARAPAIDEFHTLGLGAAHANLRVEALASTAQEVAGLAERYGALLAQIGIALSTKSLAHMPDTRAYAAAQSQISSSIISRVAVLQRSSPGDGADARMTEIGSFAFALQQSSDIILKRMSANVRKCLADNSQSDEDGLAELAMLFERCAANLQVCAALVLNPDSETAKSLVAEKIAFRAAEEKCATLYFLYLEKRKPEIAARYRRLVTIVSDLKSINSRTISKAAYPTLEREGLLLLSRIQEQRK